MNYGAITAPAGDAFAITPSDTTQMKANALYIGTGGDVAVVTEAGTSVVFKNAANGQVIPVRVRQVLSTNTTASDILGLVN